MMSAPPRYSESDQSGGTYGLRGGTVTQGRLALRFKKVARHERTRLFSVHLRYQRILTDSRGARDEDCPNLLRDKLEICPLRVLSSDITYIPTQEGFAYTRTIRPAPRCGSGRKQHPG